MSDRRPERNGGSNKTGTAGPDGVEYSPSEKATNASASPREILESHLDEKDYEVFKALNENGRMSDTEIADRVGLSRSAVRRRRESLLDDGILEVLAVIVLQEADLAYADVRVSMDENASREARDRLIERLVDADLFYAVHSTLGDHDVLAQGWHASLGELKRYVEDLLADAEVVDAYDITPAVKTWKDWDKVLDRPTK
jgi:DNA-binding Lrp family transcriptional regulator